MNEIEFKYYLNGTRQSLFILAKGNVSRGERLGSYTLDDVSFVVYLESGGDELKFINEAAQEIEKIVHEKLIDHFEESFHKEDLDEANI